MFAEVFADDIASTVTIVTTDIFYAITGSTLFTGQTFAGDVVVARPHHPSSPRLQMGHSGKGLYLVDCSICFTGAINSTYHVAVHKNSTQREDLSAMKKIGSGGDIVSISMAGYVRFRNTTDYIDFRVNCDTTNVQMTISHFSLRAYRITTSTALSTWSY